MSATVLIVEDEKSISTLLKYNLEKEGYKIIISQNGEDGIEQVKICSAACSAACMYPYALHYYHIVLLFKGFVDFIHIK